MEKKQPPTRESVSDPVVAVKNAGIHVELVSDPWSVWCWGFEPVRRALALRYPMIEFRTTIGGMFPQMPDPKANGFDVERFFAIVQRTTGMPVRSIDRSEPRPTTTLTSARHVYAVRQAAPEKEGAFIRAQREAIYLDGKNINERKTARELVRKIGVNVDAFDQALESGEAEALHKKVLDRLEERDLHAYPTFLVGHGNRLARIEGFQSLPAVLSVVESVSLKSYPMRPDPSLESVIPMGERVATREVAESLAVSVERANEILLRSQRTGFVRRERFPTGDVWARAPNP